jgi:hypothetical protein
LDSRRLLPLGGGLESPVHRPDATPALDHWIVVDFGWNVWAFSGEISAPHLPHREVRGKKFEASMGEDYFEVAGEFCTWRIKWPGVSLKGENKDVFVFYAENYVFIFGKKYLNNAEQDELRRLIGI